jgi:hypothetical protein
MGKLAINITSLWDCWCLNGVVTNVQAKLLRGMRCQGATAAMAFVDEPEIL